MEGGQAGPGSGRADSLAPAGKAGGAQDAGRLPAGGGQVASGGGVAGEAALREPDRADVHGHSASVGDHLGASSADVDHHRPAGVSRPARRALEHQRRLLFSVDDLGAEAQRGGSGFQELPAVGGVAGGRGGYGPGRGRARLLDPAAVGSQHPEGAFHGVGGQPPRPVHPPAQPGHLLGPLHGGQDGRAAPAAGQVGDQQAGGVGADIDRRRPLHSCPPKERAGRFRDGKAARTGPGGRRRPTPSRSGRRRRSRCGGAPSSPRPTGAGRGGRRT